ncbi:hypothetical protein EDC04DRAFT_2612577 [Pisolithus marmoratus]|nr:hypothetical protein EDC04DRAFT_2612577 [Pisolithus marmoratus]
MILIAPGQGNASDLVPAATETMAATSNLAGDTIEARPQAAMSSGPSYCLDSKMANEYLKKIKHFQILVMGRANAGKTTILQRVCNSTDNSEIFDGKGNKIESDIVQGTLALSTASVVIMMYSMNLFCNPGFVFHDSCGFEAGSTQQFDQMMNFVADHAVTARVNEHIHAIW